MAAAFNGFQSLVENSPDAISLINEQGEILYGSASNTKLFGYRPDELVGRDCIELIHPEDREHFSWSLQQVMTKPADPLQWDARIRHKDGNYSWIESTASNQLLDLDVQAIVVHQRDINDQRVVQEKNQLHSEELIRSNLRLEEFAYTAAHDLREPLRAISLYTQLLLKTVSMDAEEKQTAEFVIGSAGRMTALVDDLLSFARTGMQGPPVPVDLHHALAQALENLALEIETSGAIVTVDRLPTVRSDETHLVRIFQNLLSNALKYHGEHPITIHVTAEQRGPDWLVKVRDNGVGIAAENQSKIFLPFLRLVSRDVPGTGLGLAVCKKIAEGMGGTIWVESESEMGSTFLFTIVAHDDMPLP